MSDAPANPATTRRRGARPSRRAPARPARLALAAGALGALAALGGCGVPVNSGPVALNRSHVPFDLLDPTSPTSTSTTVPSPVEASAQIFLVGPTGHLVPVTRYISVSAPDLVGVLSALVVGPTDAEAAAGLQSAVPTQTTLLGASIAGDLATVNLSGTFGQLVGTAQIQAVAQIVYTAAEFPGVSRVAFELAGEPVDVPVASGQQVPVPTVSQFASLAPLPAGAP